MSIYAVAQYHSVTTTGVWHLNNYIRLYADCCTSKRAWKAADLIHVV